jgi:serine/threonine-protein kinase
MTDTAHFDDATRWQLADGVVIKPVATLRSDIRERIDCDDGDCIVTIPGGRARSLMVDAELGAFLAGFAIASSVADAVAGAAERTGAEAADMLHAVQPTLRRMRDNGFLVSAERARQGLPSAAPGTSFDGLHVMASCQSLDDVAVLRCADALGRPVAVKLARRADAARVNAMLAHEYAVLRSIDTPAAPAALQSGVRDGCPYIAMRWCDGQDVLAAANALRAQAGADQAAALAALRELAVRVLRAYEQLHAHEVVHGDIHPKNILVSDDGTVHIVDFGLATCPAKPRLPAAVERSGVPYFYEPAYAASVVAGSRAPAASQASDVYGLAALCYLILTGQHYLAFALDRDYFYRQIRHESMRPFAALGLPSWPAVEAALAAVLDAKTAHAPPRSAALAAALAAADAAAIGQAAPAHETGPPRWAAFSSRLRMDGIDFDTPLRAPTASLHFGAAGVAFALLKQAEAADDTALLHDAACWCTRASHAPARDAYASRAASIAPEVAQASSLHYGELGVCLADALVAFASCAFERLDGALQRFCAAAETPRPSHDITSGTAGVLLGCALLIEALPDDSAIPSRGMLYALGERAYAELLPHADWPAQQAPLPANLGIAHGIAGICYALLRWAEANGTAPPQPVARCLCALRGLASEEASGLRWPLPIGMARGFAASWCNGAAGMALLYGLAFESFHDPAFLDAARGAARFCASAPSNGRSLCCGDAGAAYAQLALYRLTSDPAWLQRARELAARALPGPGQMPARPDYSLYKGLLGPHHLEFDLQAPRQARMPLFEAAGWPRTAASRHAWRNRITHST